MTGRCILPIIIDPIPEQECLPPWRYSARAGGCIKPRPRPKPRENIAWIQSCLNTLGFRAGVEDGLAGRRTRGAWQAFREANGLTPFGVPFTDPATLAVLYQQCTPGKEPLPAIPQPPKCPPNVGTNSTTPGTCSSGLNYRPSLCATGKLYSLLSREYGDSIQLEKCGRSCLPVPEGMDEAEAKRQEAEKGINWCKDCVTVGDEGILCPTPRVNAMPPENQ